MRVFSIAVAVLVAACGAPADEPPRDVADAAEVASVAAADLPSVVVFKSPTCGCCNGWIDHLRAAGFEVEGRDTRTLMEVKIDAGVPTALSSCHTAVIDGYVLEGHVPADVIKRLLAERPDVAGIAVPGMPTGSPGMEGPGARPYEVLAFDRNGNSEVYTEVDPR